MKKKIDAFCDELDKLVTTEDKYESLYVFIVYNKTTQEFINFLFEYLKKIKQIGNSFKKKYLNNRIYNFIESLKETKNKEQDIINKICFVGENIYTFDLMESSILLLTSYNIDNIYVKYGNKYDIGFIKDFLFDESIKHLIEEEKNGKYLHHHINTTKGRKLYKEFNLRETDIVDYINGIHDKIIFNGNQLNIKKINPNKYVCVDKKLSNDQIFGIFEKDLLQQNNKKLDIIMGYINDTKMMDKLLFGTDLAKAIKNYQVKTIFCTNKMFDKLTSVYSSEYLNFEINMVKSYDDGDSAFILESNYRGIVGVKYY